MRSPKALFSVVLSVLCLFAAASVSAQSSSVTLSGSVVDENGAVVPDTEITVLNLATSFRRETVTNDEGYFTVPLLPPGTYSLTAMRDGFKAVAVSDIVLNVNDVRSLRIQLRTGDVKETVDITGEAPLIDESPAVGTVVDRQFVANLPLNGRSFQSLIALSPGVVLTKATAAEAGQFSVNGQRASANYFTVDGVSANIGSSAAFTIGQSGAGALPGLTAVGGTNNLVSVDALQEFKIQTSSYAAEFGRQPGGQISLITRSGTNDFHGTLFDYVRNDVFDANDWFANSLRLAKPPLRQNDFGGTLGGPILLPRFGEGGHQPGYDGRNRTFFFFSYEGLRLRQPVVGIVQVPSLEVRQTAPASLQPFLNAYPRPTGPAMANGFAQFAASYSNPATLNATSIRIDHTVGQKLTLFGRYNDAPSETAQRGNALNTLTTSTADTQTVTLGANLAFSSGVSNELRANYSHLRRLGSSRLDEFGGAVVLPDSVLFPQGFNSQNSLFTLSMTGGSVLSVGLNVVQLQRQINLVDNLSVVTGTHQLKFGVDYRRLFPRFEPRAYAMNTNFNGIGITASGIAPPVGSVRSGRINFGSVTSQAEAREPILTNLSLYGQDTWRTTRRLTLTYGWRWEVNPAPYEKNGNETFTVIGLDNPATAKLGPRSSLYETTYANLAPRFGVAYQLSQRPGRETVIRGGIGLFYDLGSGGLLNAYGNAFPFMQSRDFPSGTIFPYDPALTAPVPISLIPSGNVNLSAPDPDLKLPRVYQWNFAVEQSLGANQTVTASYVAAIGRSLLKSSRLLLSAGANPNFPGGAAIGRLTNGATSDYHALQLQFQRRLSRGLQALASYTWSQSIDIASADSSLTAPDGTFDPQQDRGPSDFDVRHSFSSAITYDLPKIEQGRIGRAILGDWSVDTIFSARTATPVDIISSRSTGSDTISLRVDLVPGVPLYLDDPLAPGGRRFNPAAFVIPTALRQGTLGRNALRGFGIWQVDTALRRQFNLTEHLKLQLRAEAFNVFNHPNFADPNGTRSNLNIFGRSASMLGRSLGSSASGLNPLYQVGGPRSMQLAAKLIF
jgi:carboxypeptidase family protein